MNAKPFDESRESQDDYCADCAHVDACNVMLKDGEDCGDRTEAEEDAPMCGDCAYYRETKASPGTSGEQGGRLCRAVEMTIYPMSTACDSFDEAERIPEGLTPEDWGALTPAEQDTARGLDELTRLPDPDDEEADDFNAQVRNCLAHWPGIQAVDLDA